MTEKKRQKYLRVYRVDSILKIRKQVENIDFGFEGW